MYTAILIFGESEEHMKYVAIKLQGDNNLTPAQIINEHYRFANSNEGKVYFSTDIRFDLDKNSNMSAMILFFEIRAKNSLNMMFVRANICTALNSKNCTSVLDREGERIVPSDSPVYSPGRYRDELKRTWFLLDHIQLVDEAELSNLYTIDKTGITQRFIDIIKTERRNPRLYLTDECLSEEDDLISDALLAQKRGEGIPL